MAAESVATYEWFQAQRGGASYVLFEGNKTKAAVFRIFVASPIIFFSSWIAPGLFCWWLYGQLPRVSIIIGALYYMFNIGWVILYLTHLTLYRLRGGKSFKQRAAELIPAPLQCVSGTTRTHDPRPFVEKRRRSSQGKRCRVGPEAALHFGQHRAEPP
jgi:hypothetical protein